MLARTYASTEYRVRCTAVMASMYPEKSITAAQTMVLSSNNLHHSDQRAEGPIRNGGLSTGLLHRTAVTARYLGMGSINHMLLSLPPCMHMYVPVYTALQELVALQQSRQKGLSEGYCCAVSRRSWSWSLMLAGTASHAYHAYHAYDFYQQYVIQQSIKLLSLWGDNATCITRHISSVLYSSSALPPYQMSCPVSFLAIV